MAVLARVDSLGDRFVIGCAIQYLLTCAHDAGQEVLVKWVVGAITDGALKSHAGDDPRLFVLAANAECVYGEPSGAHALLDRALSMRGLADPADVAHVCLVRGIVYFVEGRLAEAREELQKARHGNQNARVDGLESRACVNLGVVLLEQGELEKARLVLADARSVASRHEQLVVLANQAVWCIQTGRYDLLVGAISEMESINATLRVQWVEPVCMTLRAFWYLQHGYTSRAVEIADQLAAVMPFGRRDITDMSYSELAICRAWFRDGRAAPAIRRLEDALENFPAAQWAGKLRLLTELASCLRSSDPTRARSILASVRAQARTKGAFAHILAADRVANHLPA